MTDKLKHVGHQRSRKNDSSGPFGGCCSSGSTIVSPCCAPTLLDIRSRCARCGSSHAAVSIRPCFDLGRFDFVAGASHRWASHIRRFHERRRNTPGGRFVDSDRRHTTGAHWPVARVRRTHWSLDLCPARDSWRRAGPDRSGEVVDRCSPLRMEAHQHPRSS